MFLKYFFRQRNMCRNVVSCKCQTLSKRNGSSIISVARLSHDAERVLTVFHVRGMKT